MLPVLALIVGLLHAQSAGALQTLYDSTFEQETRAGSGNGLGSWAVLFCASSIEECAGLRPVWAAIEADVVQQQQQQLALGEVDLFANHLLAHRFNLTARQPTILLFRDGKMLPAPLETFPSAVGDPDAAAAALKEFFSEGYQSIAAQQVPPPLDTADGLFEGLGVIFAEMSQSAWGIAGMVLLVLILAGLGLSFVIMLNPDVALMLRRALPLPAAAGEEGKRVD